MANDFYTNRDNAAKPINGEFFTSLGLTPAEIRIARMIARGQSPREAARALGISYNTVRAQLKSIYAKTNTRRQSALAVLIVRMEQRQ